MTEIQASPIEVSLEDFMGSDLRVANVARVSFAKRSASLRPEDIRLLAYLADHNHWTPFAHVFASFRIRCCIAVARQLAKHQVGLVWNEESRRYIRSDPLFFVPADFREAVADKKQGSGRNLSLSMNAVCKSELQKHYAASLRLYQWYLEMGVCEEQARLCLPVGAHTEFIWSGSLAAFARVVNLRVSPDAQKETKDVAELILKQLIDVFPHSIKKLCKVAEEFAPEAFQ